MSDSVGQYLNEIGLVPLLTAQEERELSQIIERGRDAQQRLDTGDSAERDEQHARVHRLTTPTSLDRPVGEDDGSELIDLIADVKPGPEDMLLTREQDNLVTGLLDVLEPRARYAVEQRFGIHDGRKRSYREVGDELGVTAEAARRLVKRAVNTVKEEAAARVDAA